MLMFGTSLALSIVFVLLCQQALADGTFSTQYVLTDAQRQQFVSRINQMRSTIAASDMREIQWDPKLEAFALEKAKKCSFNQLASYRLVADHETVGLNMFATSEAADIQDPIQAAMQEWWSKKQFYTYGPYQTGQCINNEACVNYIQMITASTNSMGCAAVNCSLVEGAGPVSTGSLPICAFSPNIKKGEPPYTEGERCGRCKTSCTAAKLCTKVDPLPASTAPNTAPTVAISHSQPTVISPTTTVTMKTTTISRAPVCTDLFPLCSFWAQAGECDKNVAYMKGNCSAACSRCEPKKVLLISLDCEDTGSQCQEWFSSGLCMSNPHFMIWQCPRLCGFCNSPGQISYPPLIRA